MIIECEQCKTKFNLDESLLKNEGSKVRCSICQHIFLAYQPKKAPIKTPDLVADAAAQETKAVNDQAAAEDKETEIIEKPLASDIEMGFKGPGEKEVDEEAMPEQFPEEEALGMEEALEMEADAVTKEGVKEAPKPGREAPAMETVVAPSRAKGGRPSRLPAILLFVLLLLVCGAVAVYFLAPELLPESLSFLKPPSKQMTDMGARRLSPKEVAGFFVESEKAGRVFVIKGNIVNEYPQSRSFILVKGTILDDKGEVVKTKMAYAGNVFSEKQVEDMTLEEIDAGLKNRLGKGNMNINLGSGGSVPFMIIIGDLPENLSEFTVEAVSSSPGK